ncbi:MAG: DUF3488 and transglutaminase-like domain-containing protein [Propionibacteriaceae bacterium]|jgi:hypothetical protein|nr:DUF3488 and transglutaminase-like domain-containing protein [Propionibacteriaceae bacterium]
MSGLDVKRLLVDAAAVLALLATAFSGFWLVYGGGGFIRPALIGVLVGLGIALLGVWRRFGALLVAAGTLVAYFLFGTVAALPEMGIGGVLPDGAALRELTFGSVEVWRGFVTASVPVSAFPSLALLPYILGLLAAVCAFSAAWRAKRPAWALLPIAVLEVSVIALGTNQPSWPLLQAGALLAVSLAWLAWRSRLRTSGEHRMRHWPKALVQLGVVGLVFAFAVNQLGDAGARQVIRDYVEPPIDLQAYSSPLSSYRRYVKDIEEPNAAPLFTVAGWSEPNADRLRLAVLDSFDGMVMNVAAQNRSGRYTQVGEQLGQLGEAAPSATERQITVTVGSYTGIWMPTLSASQEVEFSDGTAEQLYYNPSADALINLDGLREGNQYVVYSAVSPTPGEAALADVPVGEYQQEDSVEIPQIVSTTARKMIGDTESTLERIKLIRDGLRSGFFSHGLSTQTPSNAGHSTWRISQLLAKENQWVGDDEQYAVAMTLMLHSLGIPARVVMGFYVDEDSNIDGQVWKVMGGDAHAWVEVPFEGVGWVPFYPTPDKNKQMVSPQPKSMENPRPQVLQPPIPPEEPAEQPYENTDEDKEDEEEEQTPFDWGFVLMLLLAIGIPLLVLLGPPAAIMLAKARRSAKRKRALDTSRQISGGWRDLVDYAADLQAVPPATATRQEVGETLADHFETPTLLGLAAVADYSVFGAEDPTPAQAEQYWEQVAAMKGQLGSHVGFFGRVKGRFALTSFRKKRRPTVG